MRTQIFLEKNFKISFVHKKLKKNTIKSCLLMAVGSFFSLQPRLPKTAQNFISVLFFFSIRPSLLESLPIKDGAFSRNGCVNFSDSIAFLIYWAVDKVEVQMTVEFTQILKLLCERNLLFSNQVSCCYIYISKYLLFA